MLLRTLNSCADKVVILNEISLNIEAVVAIENLTIDIFSLKVGCCTEVRHEGALTIGRYQCHALARALVGAKHKWLDAYIAECLLVELTCVVLAHLADKSHLCAEACHSTYGVARRATK